MSEVVQSQHKQRVEHCLRRKFSFYFAHLSDQYLHHHAMAEKAQRELILKLLCRGRNPTEIHRDTEASRSTIYWVQGHQTAERTPTDNTTPARPPRLVR